MIISISKVVVRCILQTTVWKRIVVSVHFKCKILDKFCHNQFWKNYMFKPKKTFLELNLTDETCIFFFLVICLNFNRILHGKYLGLHITQLICGLYMKYQYDRPIDQDQLIIKYSVIGFKKEISRVLDNKYIRCLLLSIIL